MNKKLLLKNPGLFSDLLLKELNETNESLKQKMRFDKSKKNNNRKCTVYEYLWNDVKPNVLLIFKVDNKLILYLKSNYTFAVSQIFVYCTFSIIFFGQRLLPKCWLIADYENICWIFLLLYHKSLK